MWSVLGDIAQATQRLTRPMPGSEVSAPRAATADTSSVSVCSVCASALIGADAEDGFVAGLEQARHFVGQTRDLEILTHEAIVQATTGVR